MGTASVMGTAAYSATEVFNRVYSDQSDIWALRCEINELLFKTLFWTEVARKPTGIQRHFIYKRGPSILPSQNREAKILVSSCLQLPLKDRPSATVGSVTPRKVMVVFEGARAFFETAVDYSLKNLRHDDLLLKNSQSVNFNSRIKADQQQAEYFL